MPADTTARSRKGKKRSIRSLPEAPEQLSEHERVIEVCVRATVRDASEVPAASLQSFLRCLLCGEETLLRLDTVFGAPEEAVSATAPKGKPQRRPAPVKGVQEGEVDLVVAEHRLTLDLPTLTRLLCMSGDEGDDTLVAIHAPPPPPPPSPPPAVVETSSSGRGKGQKGKPSAKESAGATNAVAPTSPSSKGKAKTAAGAAASKAEERYGDVLTSVRPSFLDVMHTTEHSYPLALNIPGIEDCRVILRCRDDCLTPLAVRTRFRPVCFTLRGLDHLPEDMSGSLVQVAFEGMGHRFHTPPLRVLPDLTAARSSSSPMSSFPSQHLFRTVRFLGDLPPLSVYQAALLEPIKVSLLRTEDEEGTTGQRNQSVGGTAVTSSGDFSVRDWVADRQTFFDVTVPLAAASRAAAVTGGQHGCLVSTTTCTCSVDFSLPLPPLVHVDDAGEPAPKDALLTRGVAILPFSAPWLPGALGCLLKQLLRSQRATKGSDVALYEPPPATPAADSVPFASVGGLAMESATWGGTGASSAAVSMSNAPSSRKPLSGNASAAKSTASAASGTAKGERGPLTSTSEIGEGSRRQGATLRPSTDEDVEGAAENAPAPWPFEAESIRVVSPAGISGFEVADGQQRVVCLEGPAGEVHRIFLALHHAAQAGVARTVAKDGTDAAATAGALRELSSLPGGADNVPLRLLFNPELFAARRLYASYPPLVTPPSGAGGSVATATVSSASVDARGEAPDALTDEVPAEIDEMGGGCGGRIHRVRLRDALSSLVAQQRFFLRRTLSETCLRCLLQLHALTRCGTAREAAMRNLFPSAAGVISLERSFGQTLELSDIFGEDTDPSAQTTRQTAGAEDTSDGEAWDAVVQAATQRIEVDDGVLQLATALDTRTPNAVGQLVSFEGRVLVDSRRTVPAVVAARHPRTLWMVSDEGTEVLCAFTQDVPGGTVRYHVEGQVTQVSGCPLRMLYILAFHTLAKSFTNSRNPSYERKLAERRRQEAQRHTYTRRLQVNPAGAEIAPLQQTASGTAGQPTVRGTHGMSSDEDDDDNDAHNPPVWKDANVLRAFNNRADASSVSGAAATTGHYNDGLPPIGSGTKTTKLRAALNLTKKTPEPDYDLLWKLYEKRAPKPAPL